MSNAPSQQPLPRQIDPRKFAQQGVSLKGSIAFSALSRVANAVQGRDGEVAVDLVFAVDEQKTRTLTGTADARVNVICQRCLDVMDLGLHCRLNLAMVWDEEDARQLPRYMDPWIVGEGTADLYEVIEDELLLALPIVAYHDSGCVEPSLFSAGEPVEEGEKPENNPFQVLEQLKGGSKN